MTAGREQLPDPARPGLSTEGRPHGEFGESSSREGSPPGQSALLRLQALGRI